jgi:hypothetical protein
VTERTRLLTAYCFTRLYVHLTGFASSCCVCHTVVTYCRKLKTDGVGTASFCTMPITDFFMVGQLLQPLTGGWGGGAYIHGMVISEPIPPRIESTLMLSSVAA